MEFPIRINHYLATTGVATRKGADKLIADRKVFVNGKVAVLGQKVNEGDKVEVKGQTNDNLKYFAYNKPIGIETKDIVEKLKLQKGLSDSLFPIGRLDKDSSGLIILTNDGRITDRLLNPNSYHEKEYRVAVDKPITNTLLRGLKGGLEVGKFKTRKAMVRKLDTNTFEIILTEGQNRQIRRMVAAFGYKVRTLTRFRIMNIKLGKMRVNELREIVDKELDEFLKTLGLLRG